MDQHQKQIHELSFKKFRVTERGAKLDPLFQGNVNKRHMIIMALMTDLEEVFKMHQALQVTKQVFKDPQFYDNGRDTPYSYLTEFVKIGYLEQVQ